MKNIFLAFFLFLGFVGIAQRTTVTDRLIVNDSLSLSGKYVKGISIDTVLLTASNDSLITQYAIKRYIAGQAAGVTLQVLIDSIAELVDTAYLLQDTIRVFVRRNGTSWQDTIRDQTLSIQNDTLFLSGSLDTVPLPPLMNDINDGLAEDKPTLTVVNSSGLKLDIEKIGGGDIVFQVDGVNGTLDCTTGAGVGGKARVALTAGADANNPATNYIYVTRAGAVLTLVASTALPTGAFGWVGKVVVPDATTWAITGSYALQRFTESKNDSRGQISHGREKLRALGAVYISGAAQSTEITTNGGGLDNVHLEVDAGSVYQLHRQTWPAFTTGPYYYGNGANQYEKITDLNAALAEIDGTSLSGKRFNLVIWGAVNYSTGLCKLYVNLPNGSYTNNNQTRADRDNTADYSVPLDMRSVAFLISRMALRHQSASSGTWTELETYSLLGTPLGVRSGGASVIAANEFKDTEFRVFDDGDETKLLAFEMSGVTTGTTRTLTVPDASGTISLVGDDLQTYAHSGTTTYQNTLSDGGGTFTLTSDGIVYISQVAGTVQIGATEVQNAPDIDITDAGGYYTGTEVETALQEIGSDLAAAGSGTVTSVAAGNGMDFTTITASGSATMGTPSTLTGATTNALTTTSHTHDLDIELTDNTDVGVTTQTNRNVLVADGDSWESRALVEADISDLQAYLTSEIDGSITNEHQDLSYTSGTGTVNITDGNNATIAIMNNTTRGLVPDGDGSQDGEFLREDGTWQVPGGGGTVTSVAAGNGLDFTTITGSGSVVLGTPSDINGASTNSVTATSHTHNLDAELMDLTDVNTSTVTNRNVLVADGVDWESRALVEADISDLSHTTNTNYANTDLTFTGTRMHSGGGYNWVGHTFSGISLQTNSLASSKGKLSIGSGNTTLWATNVADTEGSVFEVNTSGNTYWRSISAAGDYYEFQMHPSSNIFRFRNSDSQALTYYADYRTYMDANVLAIPDVQWVRDEISSSGATISDAVYSAAWDGVTTIGASKNAIYDKIELLGSGGEVNTASSQGTGTSIFYQKSVVDLQFNAIKSENGLLSVGLDAGTHDIELTINESLIDHDALTNFLATEHFTEAAISIPLSQGANNVTASFTELNLLDLGGRTAGDLLIATGATTAAWGVLDGSDINNDLSWITSSALHNAVTVSGAYDYFTLVGQDLVRGQINLGTDVTGTLDEGNIDADIARDSEIPNVSDAAYNATTWNANTDAATKNAIRDKIEALPGGHDAVTLAGKDYLTLSSQEITANQIDLTDDVTGVLPAGNIGTHNHATTDVNSGTFADARISESSVTQHEAAIDHDALLNFTTNEHFLQSAISIPLSQGANDVTATSSEVNLLDLSGLTDGWVLSATGAATASWSKLNTSDLNNDSGFLTSGDGNGIFSALNDGQTIPSSFNSYLTNNWTIGTFFYIDESSDEVGIGTGFTSPESLLHLYGGTAGTVAAVAGSNLILEGATTNYLHFQNASGLSGLLFGDPGDNDIGGLIYDHTANDFSFSVNGVADHAVISPTQFTAGNINFDIDATVGAGQDGYGLIYNHSALEWTPTAPLTTIYSSDGELATALRIITVDDGGILLENKDNPTYDLSIVNNAPSGDQLGLYLDWGGTEQTSFRHNSGGALIQSTTLLKVEVDHLLIAGAGSAGGELRLQENGADYSGFIAHATTTESGVYVLPAADGTVNQVLATDGSFGLSWEDAGAVSTHASTHITGAGDEVDGDKVDIDWTPSNYTPATTPAEADDLDHLTAHLYGIDQALTGGGGGGGWTINTEIISGNITLTTDSSIIQMLDPGASNRTITFPATPDEGTVFYIKNNGTYSSSKYLSIRNSGASEIDVLYANDLNGYFWDGAFWQGTKYSINGTGVTTEERGLSIGHQSSAYSGGLAIGYSTIAYSLGTAIGQDATGTSSGAAVGYQANGGSWGVALGRSAEGVGGVAIGFDAEGPSGIGIGRDAGDNITSATGNILIGHQIDAQSATAGAQGSIGNIIFMDGGFGTGTSVGAGNVMIGSATDDAANRLQVTGDVKFTGDLEVTGDILSADLLRAYKTADEGKTTDSFLASDGDLSVSVVASGVYRFDVYLLTSAGTTGDFKFDFSYPSGASGYYGNDFTTWGASVIALATDQAIDGAGSGTYNVSVITGYLLIDSTPGSFSFRWAQNTSDATPTTLRKGSNMILTKLN